METSFAIIHNNSDNSLTKKVYLEALEMAMSLRGKRL